MWKIIFVNKIAEEELLNFTADIKARFLRIADMISKLGPQNLGMPHIKHLSKDLWEIRLRGKDNIARSIYSIVSDKQILILHSFIKKTQKTPHSAIEISYKRLKEYQNDH